jgi:hypothetical protein
MTVSLGKRIFSGPPSRIEQHTRGQHIDAVRARISALEAIEPLDGTPGQQRASGSRTVPAREAPDALARPCARAATATTRAAGAGGGHGARSLRHIQRTHRGISDHVNISDTNENLPAFPYSLDSAATRTNAHVGSSAATRPVRRRPAADSVAVVGARAQRQRSLTREDLWLNGAGPPELDSVEEHHKCAICHCVKSHPVT